MYNIQINKKHRAIKYSGYLIGYKTEGITYAFSIMTLNTNFKKGIISIRLF